MHRRPFLILGPAAAAIGAVLATAAIGAPLGDGIATPNGNVQSIGVLITPKKLAKAAPKTAATPANLEVTTKLTNASSPVPKPTVRAVVDFDKNASIFTKGLPTCDPSKLQSTSTEVALQQCGPAKIGGGTASALLPAGQIYTVNQTVTAFNGVPQGGKPVIILHTYGTTPIQTTLVIVGTLSGFNKEGYGPRLDLEVPKIAGGTGALTDFSVKVGKRWRYKGKQVSFISAKCPNSKKLKARGAFSFIDGESSTSTSVQSCTQKK